MLTQKQKDSIAEDYLRAVPIKELSKRYQISCKAIELILSEKDIEVLPYNKQLNPTIYPYGKITPAKKKWGENVDYVKTPRRL